uniref:cyclodeaminase/cyclohydrolase family protein n=1 Tax=Eubacterium cellulosolvens TaxID=29322 RepID=UPI000482C156|nr:cyclodeaminase/cyclohydrolase family protein [[Eubacterium] cellulosolvens]
MTENTTKLMDLSCSGFTELLASKAPVPGGGGASALVASLGAALCNMVGNLTIGKKKYANVEEEIKGLMERITRVQKDLEELVQEDADSFAPLSAAYRMPTGTEEERAEKDRVMEECLKQASDAPIRIMHRICDIISMIGVFENKGSYIAVSDAGVAAAICSAALRGAALNVFINTKYMKDREYAAKLNRDAEEMLDIYGPLGDHIYSDVHAKLMEGQEGGING